MKIKCVNNHGNGNFTIGKEYEVIENPDKSKTSFGKYIVTCDFIHIFVDKVIRNKDILTVALSKFEIVI
jgi:hypothetical protein